MRAVLNEMSRSAALSAAMQDKFVHHRNLLIKEVLAEAVDRGEIDAEVINPEIWDVLPGYLVFRALVSERPPTDETVRALVDEVLMPSLPAQPEPLNHPLLQALSTLMVGRSRPWLGGRVFGAGVVGQLKVIRGDVDESFAEQVHGGVAGRACDDPGACVQCADAGAGAGIGSAQHAHAYGWGGVHEAGAWTAS